MSFSFAQGSDQNAGLLSHKIQRNELKSGDHIYSYRRGYVYSHHGIYAGDGMVIHFIGTMSDSVLGIGSIVQTSATSGSLCPTCGDRRTRFTGVVSSCLECFLKGGELYKFQYGVSPAAFVIKIRGGCTTAVSDPADRVIHRAEYLLKNNGFGEYNLHKNNCEDFALYCKTEMISCGSQGRSSQATSFMAFAFAANKAKSSPVAACAFGINYCKSRYKNDLGVRSDVKKIAVEDLASHSASE